MTKTSYELALALKKLEINCDEWRAEYDRRVAVIQQRRWTELEEIVEDELESYTQNGFKVVRDGSTGPWYLTRPNDDGVLLTIMICPDDRRSAHGPFVVKICNGRATPPEMYKLHCWVDAENIAGTLARRMSPYV